MHHRPAVEIRGLHYSYPDGTPALRGVELVIEEGESVGIVGPNGAGKSTLLLHLNGILAGRGEVKIFGIPVVKSNLKEIRRRVGLVFQDPDDQLFSPTVFDDVAFGPINMGLSPEEVEDVVKKALRQVGLKGFERRSAFHLSFGQKKRAAIATVLSMNPDLLALDEPSSNLDPRARRELSELLQSLKVTKIIVTHDLPFVFENCERVVVMSDGRVVADGDAFTILSDENLLERYGLELPYGYCPLPREKGRPGRPVSEEPLGPGDGSP